MMYVSDLERAEMCVRVARTQLMMAKLLAKKYGWNDDGVKSYLKEAKEAGKLARYYKNLYDADSTDIIDMSKIAA